MINGKVGQAQIVSASGIIRVLKGVYGTSVKTSLKAASQVQSPVVEYAQVEAGSSVITETIVNSGIRCDKPYPFLDVQIGRLTEEIITIEENCNIHAEENSVLLV